MTKLDFATVCYDRELPMIELQLRSFHRFMDPAGLGRIIVVWNSNETGDVVRERLGPGLARALGPLAPHLMLLARHEVADHPALAAVPGWISQQVLKLAVAARVTTEAYCLLDAKNHFLAPVSVRTFFAEDGRALARPFDYRKAGLFRTRLVNSLAYFGVEARPEHLVDSLPTITPMIMLTDKVRDMMDAVAQRGGTGFIDAFLAPPLGDEGTTEFLLYTAYMSSREPLGTFYAFAPTRCVTFFVKAPSHPVHFAELMAQVTQPETIMLGIHKGRIPRLTADDRAYFRKVWVERGLFEDDAAAQDFLAGYL